jgi:saccharopine dehydrogenase (NAD+, L-lysine-forming)
LAVGAQQKEGGRLGELKPFKNEGDMVEKVKEELSRLGRPVRALVIGALGRCGGGAVDLFRKVGLKECASFLPLTS